METHSSIPAWGISWTEDPGGLHSIGSQIVGPYGNDLACTHMGVQVWWMVGLVRVFVIKKRAAFAFRIYSEGSQI